MGVFRPAGMGDRCRLNNASVLKNGRILKLTQNRTFGGFFSREWKERWVVVRSDTLAVYREQRDKEPKGSIARGFCTGILTSSDQAYQKACPDPKEHKKWGITVLCGDADMCYHMAAENEHEFQQWYQVLTQWYEGAINDGRRGTASDGSLEHSFGDKIQLQDYTKEGAPLGQGGTAAVWKVKDRKGGIFAMKRIATNKLNNMAFNAVLAEAETLRKLKDLHHPYLVRFYEFFTSDNMLYLILEYCALGNLYELKQEQTSKRFGVRRTRLYLAETALAMEALHQLGLTHYDLKLENLLLDCDGHIKLCDFGFTKPDDDGKEVAGYTEIYAAPEILKGEHTGPAADWWALGVLLYECLSGVSPFRMTPKCSLHQMRGNVTNPAYAIPALPDCICGNGEALQLKLAHNLVCELLQRDPSARMSTEDAFWGHMFNAGLSKQALMAKEVPINEPMSPNSSGPTRCSFGPGDLLASGASGAGGEF